MPQSRSSSVCSRATITAALLFPAGGIVALAHAQPSSYNADPRQRSSLRLVDQGVEDQSLLSASTRRVPMDLRQPLGFDQLFQIMGPGGRLETHGISSTGDASYVRISGGLTASFTRSTYAEIGGGLQLLIPPGTVFSIGQAQAWGPGGSLGALLRPHTNAANTSAPTAMARGVSRSARSVPTAQINNASQGRTSNAPSSESRNHAGTTEPEQSESLWTNEPYRRRVLDRLFLFAAGR